MADCGCGGSSSRSAASGARRAARQAAREQAAQTPVKREGGPQDRGSGYYSRPYAGPQK